MTVIFACFFSGNSISFFTKSYPTADVCKEVTGEPEIIWQNMCFSFSNVHSFKDDAGWYCSLT